MAECDRSASPEELLMDIERCSNKRMATEDLLDSIAGHLSMIDQGQEGFTRVISKKKRIERKKVTPDNGSIQNIAVSPVTSDEPIGSSSTARVSDQSDEPTSQETEEVGIATENTSPLITSVHGQDHVPTDIADRNNSMAKSSREKFFNYKGVLKQASEVDFEDLRRDENFEESAGGSYKIIIRLDHKKRSTSKGKNLYRIQKLLISLRIKPISLVMSDFSSAIIQFMHASDAKQSLQIINSNSEKTGLGGSISRNSLQYQGVISDYPDPLIEFLDHVTYPDDIKKVERLYRTKFDKEANKRVDEATDHIIVTFRGSQIRQELLFFDGSMRMKVRPYVPNVIQCFKCLSYGHRKNQCKSAERCFICGLQAHGPCDKDEKCRNCQGNHRSTNRKCPQYERRQHINTIMAYNNISFREAVRVLEGNEDQPENAYDRYQNPQQWPSIAPGSRNQQDRSRNRLRGPKDGAKGTKSVNPPTNKSNITSDVGVETSSNRPHSGGSSRESNWDAASEASVYLSPDNSGFLQHENRKRIHNKDKTEVLNRNKEYYAQFDNRRHDISRDKRGIALNRSETLENEEILGLSIFETLRKESEKKKELLARILLCAERDWELKSILTDLIEEVDVNAQGIKELNPAKRDSLRESIAKRNSELREEEERSRMRRITDSIKNRYWSKSRRNDY